MRDDIVAQADVAGHALHPPVAGEAAVSVVSVDHGEDELAGLLRVVCDRVDHHLVSHSRRAGELEAARAFDLDQAGPAAGVRRQTIDVAEVRDVEAVLLDHFDERGALRRFDRFAVDSEMRHSIGPPSLHAR